MLSRLQYNPKTWLFNYLLQEKERGPYRTRKVVSYKFYSIWGPMPIQMMLTSTPTQSVGFVVPEGY